MINIDQVDFGCVERKNGVTIYRRCFEKYLNSRFLLKKSKAEWSNVLIDTEKLFNFLVEEGFKNGYNVNLILEKPDLTGLTCFGIASDCSIKISSYCTERVIKLNSITTDMYVPKFRYPKLTMKMMDKGINPRVIDCKGYSQIDRYPSSFQSEEAKRLLATFPRSVHFSIEDIQCTADCQAHCPSKFEKFFYKNGPLVTMTDENRIGTGGFGMVFKELFHGVPMAMKCMLMGKIQYRDTVDEAVSDFEKNISELRIQIATVGSGIIVPVAFIRQQNQEKDANGKWIAKNYNIYIYPLYDCDLYKLHEDYFALFTEIIVGDIIHQCFIRIGSQKKFCNMQIARLIK